MVGDITNHNVTSAQKKKNLVKEKKRKPHVTTINCGWSMSPTTMSSSATLDIDKTTSYVSYFFFWEGRRPKEKESKAPRFWDIAKNIDIGFWDYGCESRKYDHGTFVSVL